MDYELLLLIAINGFCFYIKFKYGIYFLIFWLFLLIFGFFFSTNGIEVTLGNFEENEIFYISKKGMYDELYSELKTYHTIKKKFKLPSTYKPFGIFYDNPDKSVPKNNRCIIGIIHNLKKETDEKNEIIFPKREKEDENNFNDRDFKTYMRENNYKNITIPKTKCIIGFYESFFSVMNSINYIAKIYIKWTNAKFFARLYNPRWRSSQIKIARRNYNKKDGVLEIYDNHIMKFFISIENKNNFNLFY